MEIQVLGPLEVIVDDAPVALPGHKARVLLAALVVHAGEVVSIDRLQEILWGAQPPASADNTLHTYIAQLRKALEPDRRRRESSRNSRQARARLRARARSGPARRRTLRATRALRPRRTARRPGLTWAHALFALATGDHEGARTAARETYDAGRMFGVPELEALGLTFQGYILVREGRVREGLKLIDEGMTWAVGGELAPIPSAVIFCRSIVTCYELGDYRRAGEWMEAIADCFARTGIAPFAGDCEAHRLGILIGRGAWSQCELDARRACGDCESGELTHVGLVFAEIGDIRLRIGDLDGAEEAFAQSTAYGHSPHPGLALLQLARGETEPQRVRSRLRSQTRPGIGSPGHDSCPRRSRSRSPPTIAGRPAPRPRSWPSSRRRSAAPRSRPRRSRHAERS